MASRSEEIVATVIGERFRFGEDYPYSLILDATVHPKDGGSPRSAAIKARLDDDKDEIEPSLSYRFYGHWNDYTNRRTGAIEKQFVASSFCATRPHTKAGIVKYLSEAPGIGAVLARRLWDAFQGDAVSVLRNDPQKAAATVPSLRLVVAEDAAAYLAELQDLEDVHIELTGLLANRGFPKRIEKQAIKEFGNRAAEVIRTNPYALMRFRGCGFLRTDALYLHLGKSPRRLKRQALCVWHAIASASNGSTWQLDGVVNRPLAKSIGGAAVQPERAINLAIRGGILAATRTDGSAGDFDFEGRTLWLADARKAANEAILCHYIVELLQEPQETLV